MSDVLVRGMEMPKGCNVCRFMKFQGSGSVFCRCNGKRIEYSYSAMKKRPDFCPLVEVPTPHGRLIDADALVNNCEKYIKTLNPDRDGKEIAKIRWLVGILNEQQTIIEAERSAE